MATIVRGTVPASQFALNHALETLPDVEVECERIVRSGDDAVMPLLWVRYADREEVEAAFEADPSVGNVTCLSDLDEELLYRMDWIDHVDLLLQMLTNAEATVLDAYGRGSRWKLRVLYPERDEFSTTHEFCAEHGLSFDVASIREIDGEPAGRFGLTESQYRALVLAVQRGYYEVPRRTTLEELADEVGVSHQALSERLRRATGSLAEDALLVGALPEEMEGW
ncbi:MAG: helix-turn-helix domain-containing protein [Haloarculaceae archaeon]